MSDPDITPLLRVADSCLIHGQRLAEWCGHAPVLEEDIALANIALDHIGQARALLTLAGQREGRGRDEDALAYGRLEGEFFNVTMVELPNGDFARTLLRLFLWSSFAKGLWQTLAEAPDENLAGIAAKHLKECRYHQRHSADWVLRLGDGTEESSRRTQLALLALWPYTAEWFGDAAWPALRAAWLAEVLPMLAEATLDVPADTPFLSSGIHGRHSEHMGPLLAEMQSVTRAFPGAVW